MMLRSLPWRKPLLLIFLSLLTACSPGAQAGSDASNQPIRAVATIGMITDIVQIVGGGRVDVTGLMGPGVDPHLYKASEGDVIRMAAADVVVYNGLHLEGKMSEIFERKIGRIR